MAKAKVTNLNVEFQIADVRQEWNLDEFAPDLITCSLILEHVEDLDFTFHEAGRVLSSGGYFYICELHPFKQYEGTKARFETDEGLRVTECFRHHVTDYTNAASRNGFDIARIDEWFDECDRTSTPRLISVLFAKRK